MSKQSRLKNGFPQEVTEVYLDIGERLTMARKRRGLSQSALAAAMFCNRQTVARMEKGDPAVALGIYLTAAFCMNLLDEFKNLLLPEHDREGNFLEKQKLDKRKRVRKIDDPDLDF